MLISVRRCAKIIISYSDSRSRSHYKVMGYTLEIDVCSISPEHLEWLSSHFNQMFLSVRRCANLLLSYLNSRTRSHFRVMGFTLKLPVGSIFLKPFKLYPHVPPSETVCRISCPDTRSRSLIYPWIPCRLHISWALWTIFVKLHPNIPFS